MAKNKQNKGAFMLRSLVLLATLLLVHHFDSIAVTAMAVRNKGRFTYADEPEVRAETKSNETQESTANATAEANSSQTTNETTESRAQTEQKQEPKEEPSKEVLRAYSETMSVKAVLEKNQGEFTGDVFESLLTGQELPHLLFSELQSLTKRLGEEFPEVIQVGSIGQSWEHRDLLYIKLDARQALQANGTSLSEAPKPEEKKEKKETASSEDDELKAFGASMGNIFVQVDQEVKGIKQSLEKKMKQVNLAQTKHIDGRLLQSGDEEDGIIMSESSSSSSSDPKKVEAPKSTEQVASSEGGSEQPQNLQ